MARGAGRLLDHVENDLAHIAGLGIVAAAVFASGRRVESDSAQHLIRAPALIAVLLKDVYTRAVAEKCGVGVVLGAAFIPGERDVGVGNHLLKPVALSAAQMLDQASDGPPEGTTGVYRYFAPRPSTTARTEARWYSRQSGRACRSPREPSATKTREPSATKKGRWCTESDIGPQARVNPERLTVEA